MEQTININIIDGLDAPDTGLFGLATPELGSTSFWTVALVATLLLAIAAIVTATLLNRKRGFRGSFRVLPGSSPPILPKANIIGGPPSPVTRKQRQH